MRKMLFAAVALVVALAASAQEPKFDFKRDTTRTSGFALPDSLAHMSPWKPDYKTNGQAWNWSPFPDAYLDARTLSFPMPR